MSCKQSTPENSKSLFLARHEYLLKEIERNKEELAKSQEELARIQEEFFQSNESTLQIFNIENLGPMQELLEQAEENEELLLFMDQKKNTWQIICRDDINLGQDLNVMADSGENEGKEEEKKVTGEGSERNVVTGEKQEHVSIIEDFEEGNANEQG